MEMIQCDFNLIIGVDVSKDKLDFSKGSQGNPKTIANSSVAIKKLIDKIGRQRAETLVVVEATGGYERLLVESLQDASITVAVVNPRRVRDFAKGIGIDAKTDPIDAKVVARYGEVVALKPAIPKTAAQKKLAALVTRRRQLLKMINMENNRLGQSIPVATKFIKEIIIALKSNSKRSTSK